MKKILIVAATAGLMSLAACEGGTTNTEAANTAVEANASIYQEDAENGANVIAENVIENATDGNVEAPANAN
ncbi:hypothetical protein [Sphingomonas sp. dw_22]|uniref:hypothetical protein n=1 Tax=Sphingomonas sp. dw_22 TaxID=2721175 RepID=UPI001BD30320|nr:hypothetical protein [Sphingomonas sp. dw_22]